VTSRQPEPASFSATDLSAALVMNLLWGMNLIAVKMGVDLIQPLTAAFLRQVFVMLICLPMLRIVPGRMRELIALGLLAGGLFYVIVNLSLSVSTNVSALAIAGQMGAPFALILAVIFLGERIARYRIGGMVLAFLGVMTLVFDPHAFDERLGLALTVLGSLVWAICSLIQRRLNGVPVLTIYAWVGLMGTVSLLPVALLAEPQAMAHVPSLPLSTFGWVAFSALGSTVIGQGTMSWLLQRHTVSSVVPLTLFSPVVAVIVSSLWFHTRLTPLMMTGGVLVMIGIAIVTIRTARARELESA
jgi:O-acetylserine/cysteine efflux transporter